MSVLDSAPKASVKYLIGRDTELREVVRSVAEHRITVVLGPRRIGKTSIVKTALSILSGKEELEGVSLDTKYIPIYVDMWDVVATSYSSRQFFYYLSNSILKTLEEYVPKAADEYRGVMYAVSEEIVSRIGVSKIVDIGRGRKVHYEYVADPRNCVSVLHDVLSRRGLKAVLAIDEAQELGSLKPFNPTMWLAHIHDHLTSIHVLLSGSYVGIMKKVLHPRHRDPLYGRDIARVNIGKLSPRALIEILLRGLQERSVAPSPGFKEMLHNVLNTLMSADLVQYAPFSTSSLESSEMLWQAISELLRRRVGSQRIYGSLEELARMSDWGSILVLITELLESLVSRLLHSLVVYVAANALLRIGFEIESFYATISESEARRIAPIIRFLSEQGGKALSVLSLFVLSGSPSLVINLAKRLPNNFTDDDLFKVGLEVLNNSYRAVCDEVNRFIASYSKKPEIILTILYSLYSSPRTWSSLVEPLRERGIDKKSVSENLKTLMELGYIAKYREGVNTYYYITDPLLFYALKEKCIGSGIRECATE